MGHEVFGPFESLRDAANTVDNLGLKGVKVENITVFANAKRGEEIDELTDVRVEDDADHSDEKGMLNRLKQMFSNTPDTEEGKSMYEQMLELDLKEEQATRYIEEIKAGKILVIADPVGRMGQDPVEDDKNLEDPVYPLGEKSDIKHE